MSWATVIAERGVEFWPDPTIAVRGTGGTSTCRRCPAVLAFQIIANGDLTFHLACPEHRTYCGPIPRLLAVSEIRKAGLGMGDVPMLASMWGDKLARPKCDHCGQPYAELHHWAPRSLFRDAYDWPMSYLCQRCHRLWHDVMREHGLRWPGEAVAV